MLALHGFREIREEFIRQFLGRAVDQSLAKLRQLAADLRLDVIGQRGAAVPSASATVAPPLANPATPPSPSPRSCSRSADRDRSEVTRPLKRADTGPTLILAVARNSVSETFSSSSQPGMQAFRTPDRSTWPTRRHVWRRAETRHSWSWPCDCISARPSGSAHWAEEKAIAESRIAPNNFLPRRRIGVTRRVRWDRTQANHMATGTETAMPMIDADGCPIRCDRWMRHRTGGDPLQFARIDHRDVGAAARRARQPVSRGPLRPPRPWQVGHHGPYSFERFGRDVLANLDALNIRTAHWCGLSMGGMVGQWLGANAADRFDRIVLANTTCHFADPTRFQDRIRP